MYNDSEWYVILRIMMKKVDKKNYEIYIKSFDTSFVALCLLLGSLFIVRIYMDMDEELMRRGNEKLKKEMKDNVRNNDLFRYTVMFRYNHFAYWFLMVHQMVILILYYQIS